MAATPTKKRQRQTTLDDIERADYDEDAGRDDVDCDIVDAIISTPPNDSVYCWGNVRRKPLQLHNTSKLPFVRSSGLGVYSTYNTNILSRKGKRAKQDEKATTRQLPVWSPWNGELSTGVTICGVFLIKRFLGGGTYGRVYEVEVNAPNSLEYHKKRYAVKFYSMCSTDAASGADDSGERSFVREAEILSAIHKASYEKHGKCMSAVVNIFGAFAYMVDPMQHKESYYPALIMELATEGSVSCVMKRVSHDTLMDSLDIMRFIGHISKKMAASLAMLHLHGFYQQDVKPSNFLCFRDYNTGEWSVKLGDMGLACNIDRPYLNFRCHPIGTRMYVAPELNILKERGEVFVTCPEMLAASEVYSLACSIRDIVWTCRMSLKMMKRVMFTATSVCVEADRYIEREKFVRSPVHVLNTPFFDNIEKLLVKIIVAKKQPVRFNGAIVISVDDQQKINRVIARICEFDRVVTQVINASDWVRRMKIADVLQVARNLESEIPQNN